jgi:hypothetical protein
VVVARGTSTLNQPVKGGTPDGGIPKVTAPISSATMPVTAIVSHAHRRQGWSRWMPQHGVPSAHDAPETTAGLAYWSLGTGGVVGGERLWSSPYPRRPSALPTDPDADEPGVAGRACPAEAPEVVRLGCVHAARAVNIPLATTDPATSACLAATYPECLSAR